MLIYNVKVKHTPDEGHGDRQISFHVCLSLKLQYQILHVLTGKLSGGKAQCTRKRQFSSSCLNGSGFLSQYALTADFGYVFQSELDAWKPRCLTAKNRITVFHEVV